MKRKDFSHLKITVQKEKNISFDHENSAAGFPPFLRGIHSTMYLQIPLQKTIIESTNSVEQKNTAPSIELANFLTQSFQFIQNNLQNNITVNETVSEITFQTFIGENYFDQIAKMRAARLLWTKMMKAFKPTNQNLLALKIQVVVDVNLEAIPIIFWGGCQSIVLKEEDALLFFEEETGISKTVDPWAGSIYIEKKTEQILNETWQLFKQKTNL